MVLTVLLLVASSSSALCLTYSVVEIPNARDINRFGQVVGSNQWAFIYENGVTTPLFGLGGDLSWASAISDQGLVVGSADTGQDYYSDYYEDWFAISHACTWHSGVITDLWTLGGNRSGANGVNNSGDIVGWSDTTAVDSRGLQISKPFVRINAQMTDLNQLLPAGSGWVLTSAYSINDSRQIIGKGKLNGVDYGYFFDLGNGTITPITNPTASWVEPSYGLNNNGAVTGKMLVGSQLHGVLWNSTGGSTDIPALPGYFHSIASDINNRDQAVGYSMDMYEESYAAFLYQCGTLTNINSLIDPASGWSMKMALRISDGGSIIAYGSAHYTSSNVVLVPVIDTAATAKATENDKPVSFRGIPVTAVFGDFFYIESIGRCSGIRVYCPGHTLLPGMAADVDGIIKTNEDGERCITASYAVQNGQASVKPVGMPLKVLGGGAWKMGAGGSGQAGVTGGAGLNNIGLLVRTWGILRQGADGIHYLDDGPGAKLLLETPAGFNEPLGQMVRLSGISSCRADAFGNVCRLLRVTAADH